MVIFFLAPTPVSGWVSESFIVSDWRLLSHLRALQAWLVYKHLNSFPPDTSSLWIPSLVATSCLPCHGSHQSSTSYWGEKCFHTIHINIRFYIIKHFTLGLIVYIIASGYQLGRHSKAAKRFVLRTKRGSETKKDKLLLTNALNVALMAFFNFLPSLLF